MVAVLETPSSDERNESPVQGRRTGRCRCSGLRLTPGLRSPRRRRDAVVRRIRSPRYRVTASPCLNRLTAWAVVLLAAWLTLDHCGVCRAAEAEAVDPLVERHVLDFSELARTKGDTEFFKSEAGRVDAQRQDADRSAKLMTALHQTTQRFETPLREYLTDDVRKFAVNLETADQDAASRVRELQQAWMKLRTSMNAKRMKLYALSDSQKQRWREVRTASVWDQYFWEFALIPFFVLGLVYLHARRHEVRKMRFGGKPENRGLMWVEAFTLVSTIAAAVFLYVEGRRREQELIDNSLKVDAASKEDIVAENQQLAAQLRTVRDQHVPLLRAFEDEQAMAAAPDGARTAAPEMLTTWRSTRAQLRMLNSHLAEENELALALSADGDRLGKIEGQLENAERASSMIPNQLARVRGPAGLLFAGVLAVGVFFKHGVIGRRRRKLSKTCTRCQAVGMLEREDIFIPAAHKRETRKEVYELVCKAPMDAIPISTTGSKAESKTSARSAGQSPADSRSGGLASEYGGLDDDAPKARSRPKPVETRPLSAAGPTTRQELCDFRLRPEHRFKETLCFPTTGVPTVGKTRWLAMQFDDVDNPRTGRSIAVVPTKGADFIRDIATTIKSGGELKATVEQLPEPVIYDYTDRDRLGRTSILASIQDFGGEITRTHDLKSPLRARMLHADGFLYFLSPEINPQEQFNILKKLCADLETVHRRKPVGIPLAVCLTKIDRLDLDKYSFFWKEFKQLPSAEGKVTAGVIEDRSRLVSALVREIFKSTGLESQIKQYFGAYCKFFPMTSKGLPGDNSPWGVQEPLLWLLHVNGYPTLD